MYRVEFLNKALYWCTTMQLRAIAFRLSAEEQTIRRAMSVTYRFCHKYLAVDLVKQHFGAFFSTNNP